MDETGYEAPAAICDRCGEEVYTYELVHLIDGFVICAECFDDFVFEYFEDCLMTGGEIKEMLSNNDTD